MSEPRPDLDKLLATPIAELEAAYNSARVGTVKPPMVCTPEGFWILNQADGTYNLHPYDPELDLALVEAGIEAGNQGEN